MHSFITSLHHVCLLSLLFAKYLLAFASPCGMAVSLAKVLTSVMELSGSSPTYSSGELQSASQSPEAEVT